MNLCQYVIQNAEQHKIDLRIYVYFFRGKEKEERKFLFIDTLSFTLNILDVFL